MKYRGILPFFITVSLLLSGCSDSGRQTEASQSRISAPQPDKASEAEVGGQSENLSDTVSEPSAPDIPEISPAPESDFEYYYVSEDDGYAVYGMVIEKYNGSSARVRIPDKIEGEPVKAVGGFKECKELTSVIIPDGVVYINESAFENCPSLTSIEIPDSAEYFGPLAFAETPWLEAKRNSSPFVIVNEVLVDAASVSGNVTIPSNVKKIGMGAFAGCESLTGAVIPDGVTKIEYGAFADCASLASVSIPNGVTAIGTSAFSQCGSLTSITLPDGLTAIGVWAFGGCTALTSVVIPDSVTEIGKAAFDGCEDIVVTYKGESYDKDRVKSLYMPDVLT